MVNLYCSVSVYIFIPTYVLTKYRCRYRYRDVVPKSKEWYRSITTRRGRPASSSWHQQEAVQTCRAGYPRA